MINDLKHELLAVDQLAKLLHKSPASIRSDASRNPNALPPICRLPWNKRLLWRLEDVQVWLARHVQRAPGALSDETAQPLVISPRKRGRPRNTAPRESNLDVDVK